MKEITEALVSWKISQRLSLQLTSVQLTQIAQMDYQSYYELSSRNHECLYKSLG